MTLNKILIDTNICLDVALKRKPFVRQSSKVLETSEEKNIMGYVAAHSFNTIFYILSKRYSKDETYYAIEGLHRTVQVAAITPLMIANAITARWNDFEDAIHHQAAVASGCDAIITRNSGDFKASSLQVLSPSEFLARLHFSQEE